MIKKISDIERLFKNAEPCINSCWIWTGPLDRDGYPRPMKIGSRKNNSRRMVRPCRLICEAPDGMVIDHLCRRRCCVNPQHLQVVTSRENTQRGWRANKRECKAGHPLWGENLYMTPDGVRACKICRKRRAREFGLATNWEAQRRYKERVAKRKSESGMK